MPRLYCGTSGWNYKHWREVFYPKGLPQRLWLSFYSQRFDTVEINFSFYRLPEESTFEKWYAEVPAGFIFAVKASRYLTHVRKLQDPEEPLQRLISRSQILREKHGPILYQFPPNWQIDLPRLENFLQMLPPDYRHVFEFRNNTWQTNTVWDMLSHYDAAYCIMDSPALPQHLVTTTDFTYIRMHGGEGSGGYYSRDYLETWSERVRDMLSRGDVYIYFNNDWECNAVQNAKTLKVLLGIE